MKGRAYKGHITTRRTRNPTTRYVGGRTVARSRMQSVPEFRGKHEIRGTRFLAFPFPAVLYWKLFYILSREELRVYRENQYPTHEKFPLVVLIVLVILVVRATLGTHVWNNMLGRQSPPRCLIKHIKWTTSRCLRSLIHNHEIFAKSSYSFNCYQIFDQSFINLSSSKRFKIQRFKYFLSYLQLKKIFDNEANI